MKGYLESSHMIRKLKPDIVFSKGGFVSVPVVLAAKRRRVPVIIHESDLTPGLANKICIPAATKVCCNFPETLKHLPENKAVLTGSPIRQELFSGKKEEGLRLCGFDDSKPVLLVMGGSLGAVAINNAIRENLDEMCIRDRDLLIVSVILTQNLQELIHGGLIASKQEKKMLDGVLITL